MNEKEFDKITEELKILTLRLHDILTDQKKNIALSASKLWALVGNEGNFADIKDSAAETYQELQLQLVLLRMALSSIFIMPLDKLVLAGRSGYELLELLCEDEIKKDKFKSKALTFPFTDNDIPAQFDDCFCRAIARVNALINNK